MFTQTLGNSVFLTVSNVIFDTALRNTIPKHAPSVNAGDIIAHGATAFRDLVTADQLPGVLDAYAESIGRTFYVAIVTGGLSFFSCMLMGWKDLRKKKPVTISEGEQQ
jgi:hypothetical protein